jgi:S1-C subfamily serine protease
MDRHRRRTAEETMTADLHSLNRILAGLLAVAILAAGCASRDGASQRKQVIRNAVASTVQLFSDRGGGVRRAGSGVVLWSSPGTGEALVLTTAHMLEPMMEQRVHALSPLRTEHLPASILAVDSESDLALLGIEGLALAPVTMKSATELGDDIWVVAFPWGRERTVVSGVVSQIAWPDLSDLTHPPLHGPVRMIDASVNHGVSGGGVFRRTSGELLGIVRGYRSAQLSFPNSQSTLNVPVAGETTVIATGTIQCFLHQKAPADRVPAALRDNAGDC